MGTTNHYASLEYDYDWAEDSSSLVTQQYMPRPERISSIPPISQAFKTEEVRPDSPEGWSALRMVLSAFGIVGVIGAGFGFGAAQWWVSDAQAPEVPIVLDADYFPPPPVDSSLAQASLAQASLVQASQVEDISDEREAPAPVETVLDRASRGDAIALDILEHKAPEERTLEEIVALSEGRIQRQRDLAWAAAILFASQNFERDSAEQVQMILAVVGDPRTFREGLLSLARIRNPIGPELIYQASRKYSHLPEVVEMAEDLLGTQAVRQHASLELSVIIDAIFVSECKAARELLERALEDADRRAVRHLARFGERSGCGVDGREDCFRCIRDGDLLERALHAARSRHAPQSL